MMQSSSVMSVKDLNQLVKDLLTDAIGQIWLMGEVSNFSQPASGHWYFTLKDDTAQVRCAMFRNANFRTTFVPQNGQQILVRANVTLYEARGEYQLVIDKLQPAGIGLLQQRFEQLKAQLQQEGLFETRHKKPLPTAIRTVGVITSSTGAALHDICQILKRRDPSIEIIIYPSLVQGEDAATQISRMIELANLRAECDVLIVGRGGGSLEDLWPFNEERVARAIFASQIPVVSAVGHEVDFTIADFVADLRAATPSAAAELISNDLQEHLKHLKLQEQQLIMAFDYYLMAKKAHFSRLQQQLQQQHPQVKLVRQQTALLKLQQRLQDANQRNLIQHQQRLQRLKQRLQYISPQQQLAQTKQRFNQYVAELPFLIQRRLAAAKHQFILNCSQLHSVSPLATLERGYSITTTQQGQVLTGTQQLQAQQTLITQLKQGKIISQITEIIDD